MSWRERLWNLYCAGAGDARASYGGAVSDDSNAMLDAMVAEIEAAERVAEAADAWNSLNGDQQECHEALAAYRALREKRDAG